MNTNIPLSARGIQLDNPLDNYGKALSLQDMIQQREFRDQQMSEMIRKQKFEVDRRNTFKKGHDFAAEQVTKLLMGPPQEPNGQMPTGKADVPAPGVPINPPDMQTIANDPRYHYFFGEFLSQNGLPDDAKSAFEFARKIEDDRREKAGKEPAGTETERQFKILRRLNAVAKERQLTEDEQLEAQTARAIIERERFGVDPTTGQMYATRPIQIPGGISVGKGAGGPGVPVNQLPPLDSGRKALDADTEKKFRGMGQSISQLISLDKMLKPDYVGFKLETAGNIAIAADRRMGLNTDRADWHQRYEQWVSDVRAEKFGLSLTQNELANFEKYKVRLSDSYELAKKNIARQQEIVRNAMRREREALRVSGQNVKQGEALLGKEGVREMNKIALPEGWEIVDE